MELELTFRSWMSRNKKPSDKQNMSCFTDAWLLSELRPKVRLRKLGLLATPGI